MASQIGVWRHPTGYHVLTTNDELATEHLATCSNPVVAQRVAHLLSLYGLEDTPIPDTLTDGTPE